MDRIIQLVNSRISLYAADAGHEDRASRCMQLHIACAEATIVLGHKKGAQSNTLSIYIVSIYIYTVPAYCK